MTAQGKIESITKPIKGSGYLVTLRLDALPVDLENKLLDVEIKQHTEKRSKDANALLWACIGDIVKAFQDEKDETVDKWDIYLKLLKRYGKYTYIAVRPRMVDAVKKQWRECEVVGNTYIGGEQTVQLICYFGSSTYDTKEMSRLLNGTISEMEQMGLQRPASSTIKRAMEEWERRYGENK